MNETQDKQTGARNAERVLTQVEIEIIAENLHDYADCLYEQARWCGNDDDAQNLRDDAAESIRLAEKIKL